MKILNYLNRVGVEASGPEIDTEFSKIVKEIKINKDLEELGLRGNGLTEKHISQLAEVLIDHKNLKSLDLSANDGLHIEAMPFLRQIIQTHPTLESLFLETNAITDDDVSALLSDNAKIFNERLKTIEINLSANHITEIGLKEIQNKLSPLSILNVLRGNYIKNKELLEQCREKALKDLETSKSVADENSNKVMQEPKIGSEGKENKKPVPALKSYYNLRNKRKIQEHEELPKTHTRLGKPNFNGKDK